MLSIFKTKRNRRQCFADTRWMDMFELEADVNGTLIVRPVSEVLTETLMQELVRYVDEVSEDIFDLIHFDLSKVVELAGPWGVHFAILIEFSHRKEIQVSAGGLREQPLALAWLFRNTSELFDLLTKVGGGKIHEKFPVSGKQVA